jgi:hypothetical protein
MVRKYIVVGVVILVIVILSNGYQMLPFKKDKEMLTFNIGENYKKDWTVVDSMVNLGHQKSALEIL